MRRMLTSYSLRIYFLNLHYVLLHFLEVRVFELSVLVKIRTLLTVSQHESGNFLQVEIFITGEGEYFVVVQVMHYNEHFRVAVSHYLLGLPEESTFFDIEQLTLLLGLFLVRLIYLARVSRLGPIHIVHNCLYYLMIIEFC